MNYFDHHYLQMNRHKIDEQFKEAKKSTVQPTNPAKNKHNIWIKTQSIYRYVGGFCGNMRECDE